MVERDISMVEKVARVAAEFDGRPFDGLGRADRERYTARARLEIMAFGEPTQSMYDHDSYGSGRWSHRSLEAVVEAALSETPTTPAKEP